MNPSIAGERTALPASFGPLRPVAAPAVARGAILPEGIQRGDRLAQAVSQAAAPAFQRAHELTETALAAAPPMGPGVHNTIQVHVHLPPECQELDPQGLQDALALHLRDAARRHGLV